MKFLRFVVLLSCVASQYCEKETNFTVDSHTQKYANGCYSYNQMNFVNGREYPRYSTEEQNDGIIYISNSNNMEKYVLSYVNKDGSNVYCLTNKFKSLTGTIETLGSIGWDYCFYIGKDLPDSKIEKGEFKITCGCDQDIEPDSKYTSIDFIMGSVISLCIVFTCISCITICIVKRNKIESMKEMDEARRRAMGVGTMGEMGYVIKKSSDV